MKRVRFALVCLAVLMSAFIAQGQSTVGIKQEDQNYISSYRQEQLKIIIDIEQQVAKLKKDIETAVQGLELSKNTSEDEKAASKGQISKEAQNWLQTVNTINQQITYLSEITNKQKSSPQANITQFRTVFFKRNNLESDS